MELPATSNFCKHCNLKKQQQQQLIKENAPQQPVTSFPPATVTWHWVWAICVKARAIITNTVFFLRFVEEYLAVITFLLYIQNNADIVHEEAAKTDSGFQL